jgi:hypothetical protein
LQLIVSSANPFVSFFSVEAKREHDVAAIAGALGSPGEQTELQCLEDIRDYQQTASGGPTDDR